MNCKVQKPNAASITGIPLVFIRTDSCGTETNTRFVTTLVQASRHINGQYIHVIDISQCGTTLPVEFNAVLVNTEEQNLLCLFRDPTIRVEALKALKSNDLFARWLFLGYFSHIYGAKTIIYLSSDTLLLAHPLHFLPISRKCSLSSVFAISQHIAVLQKPILDCIRKGFISGQAIPRREHHSYFSILSNDLLEPCIRLNADDHCRADLNYTYSMMLLREHQLAADQGMVMWGVNGSSFKRLNIQGGTITAEDSATGQPVQLTSLHLQGPGKLFYEYFARALERTRADPRAHVLFDTDHAASQATRWREAPESSETTPRETGPSAGPPGPLPSVPIVFSPLSPCHHGRRQLLLECVRQASAVVGAGNVHVLDADRCAAGRTPDGVTVVDLDLLAEEDRELRQALDGFNRSYVHLSTNSVHMERMSMARWLHLRSFVRRHGLETVVHSDGDVFHLSDPLHYPPDIATSAVGEAAPSGPPEWHRHVSVVSGTSAHASVLQRPMVECVAAAILDAYSSPQQLAKWRLHYERVPASARLGRARRRPTRGRFVCGPGKL